MNRPKLPREELYNAISHIAGTLLAVLGLIVLLQNNSHKTDYAKASIIVYSLTLISMFAVSSLYHITQESSLKAKPCILDHINIYYLIAGTYTPVALITLLHGNGVIIFYTVWIIAAIGTVLKLFYTGRYEFISLFLYLGMGWLIVLDFQNLLHQTTSLGLILLFLGGIFYTLGIIFYAIHRIPFNHFIWHLFVLAGAICHWFFLYVDVV